MALLHQSLPSECEGGADLRRPTPFSVRNNTGSRRGIRGCLLKSKRSAMLHKSDEKRLTSAESNLELRNVVNGQSIVRSSPCSVSGQLLLLFID